MVRREENAVREFRFLEEFRRGRVVLGSKLVAGGVVGSVLEDGGGRDFRDRLLELLLGLRLRLGFVRTRVLKWLLIHVTRLVLTSSSALFTTLPLILIKNLPQSRHDIFPLYIQITIPPHIMLNIIIQLTTPPSIHYHILCNHNLAPNTPNTTPRNSNASNYARACKPPSKVTPPSTTSSPRKSPKSTP